MIIKRLPISGGEEAVLGATQSAVLRTSSESIAAESELNQDHLARLTGKASRTLLSQLLQQFVRVATSLITTPIIAMGLGKELYGAWSVILQVVGYLGMSDLKPTAALRLTLATEQHDGSPERKRKLIGAAIAVWFAALPLTVSVATVVVAIMPLLLDISPADLHMVRVATACMVIGVVLDRILGIPANVLQATNQAYKAIGASALSVLVSGVLGALAVRFGLGLGGLALGTLAGLALQSVVRYVIVHRTIAWFGWDMPSRVEVRSIAARSAWLVLLGLCELLLTASDTIVVGVVWGTAAAATYSATGIAMRLVGGSLLQIHGSASSGLSGLCGAKEWHRLQSARADLLSLYYGLGMPAVAVVTAMNGSFLARWLDESYFAGTTMTLLFAMTVLQGIHVRLDSLILDSLFGFRVRAALVSSSLLVAVVVGAFVSVRFGALGVPIGIASSQMVQLIGLSAALRRATGRTIQSGRGHHRTLLVGSGLILLGCATQRLLPTTPNWGTFCILLTVASVVALAIMYCLGLSTNARQRLRARIGVTLETIRASLRTRVSDKAAQ